MVEFLHLLCRKEKFFCVGVTLFYVCILFNFFLCVGVTLFHVCILFKISSSLEFVKSLFKNILGKLILRIEEISIAVFFKQNLLVQKTALVKLTQNVLW